MKILRHTTMKNPHAGIAVPVLGSTLLHGLRQRYPELAAEFTCVFSYATAAGPKSIAAVGAEMHIEAIREGKALSVRLRNKGCVERVEVYDLCEHTPFHEQLFLFVAQFMNDIRSLLMSHYGLSPSTLLLGGWCCATRPEQLNEALVFTIPNLVCRIDEGEYHFTHFDQAHRFGVNDDLINIPRDFWAVPHLHVLQRQDVPECVDYVHDLVDLLTDLPADGTDKVVLAREVKLSLEHPVAPELLLRIVSPRRNYGNYEYVFRWGDGDAWVGISPETLLRKQQDKVVVEPLAGTRKGSHAEKSDRYRQELLSDSKEREEHETAADMFYRNLCGVCDPESVRVRESRGVLDLGYVQHLKSVIEGHVRPGINVFDVLAAVYPPATIWGKPLALCGERLRSHEKIERGFYAGGLGFATLGDDANFALAIRTARLSGNDIHVYAGSGIVKGSDPYREWLETSNKMVPFIGNEFVVNVT